MHGRLYPLAARSWRGHRSRRHDGRDVALQRFAESALSHIVERPRFLDRPDGIRRAAVERFVQASAELDHGGRRGSWSKADPD